MLEPQSTALFLVLMVVFGGLVACVVIARQPVLRLLAACLAFIPAMLFGVAAVNKYYGYYETWGAALADFTNRGVQAIPQVPLAGPGSGQEFDHLLGSEINSQQAALSGAEISLRVIGTRSKISRDVIIYLPPQYFQKQYARYRFPAIELIHGQPGEPQDWLAALNVQTILQNLVAAHQGQPVVLVMPDVNGGRAISLQCLNLAGGPADDTFTSIDVPDFVAARLRVQRPGRAWGIAGYSEGGFCAANLALRHPTRYGFAGVLSGYFKPMSDRIEVNHVVKHVDPFHHDPYLRTQNNPLQILRELPVGSQIPQFWVGAGRADHGDVLSAVSFWALLRVRDPATPLAIVAAGAHNAVAWRSMTALMLEWMTLRLAEIAAAAGCHGCLPPTGINSAVMGPGVARPVMGAQAPSQGPARGHAALSAGAAQP